MIREKLNAEPGDQLIFQYSEDFEEVIISAIKKDSLLSLYGSMPPRGEIAQKDWSDIRQEARNEMLEQKNNNK